MIPSSYSLRQLLFVIRVTVASYYIAAIYLVKEFVGRSFGVYRGLSAEKKLHRRDGQVAIITGGTAGIGLETVRHLLSSGMQVIIGTNMSPKSYGPTLQALQKEIPKAQVQVWDVDLASMKSVKEFAERFLATRLPLHVLINNAGIMYAPFRLTEDNFESHFAINYLSHCLLINLLLPCLQKTGCKEHYSRIINVASCIHFPGEINFEDLQGRKLYCKYQAYMQSKLAQIMFTQYFQQHLCNEGYYITVNSVHPGVVNSGLYRYVWWSRYVAPLLFKTLEEGAETTVYAVFSPKIEGVGGKYLEECSITQSSKYSQDVKMQEKLWNVTWTLLSKWTQIDKSMFAAYA